jgi:hypothetical protein
MNKKLLLSLSFFLLGSMLNAADSAAELESCTMLVRCANADLATARELRSVAYQKVGITYVALCQEFKEAGIPAADEIATSLQKKLRALQCPDCACGEDLAYIVKKKLEPAMQAFREAKKNAKYQQALKCWNDAKEEYFEINKTVQAKKRVLGNRELLFAKAQRIALQDLHGSVSLKLFAEFSSELLRFSKSSEAGLAALVKQERPHQQEWLEAQRRRLADAKVLEEIWQATQKQGRLRKARAAFVAAETTSEGEDYPQGSTPEVLSEEEEVATVETI